MGAVCVLIVVSLELTYFLGSLDLLCETVAADLHMIHNALDTGITIFIVKHHMIRVDTHVKDTDNHSLSGICLRKRRGAGLHFVKSQPLAAQVIAHGAYKLIH